MMIERDIPLRLHTTFKAGGPARFMAVCETEADIHEALAYAKQEGVPFYVLGEGSNVLSHDDGYEGLIILNRLGGTRFEETGETVRVTAGAGVSWDTFVREAAAREVWGVENLAGIPGTVGAAPVQNIGAYGAELSQTLESVEVMDANDGSVRTLSREECRLGYRDSRFKHESNLIILHARFFYQRRLRPVSSMAICCALATKVSIFPLLLPSATPSERYVRISSRTFPSTVPQVLSSRIQS